jgi:hypothetical protein
MKACIDIGGTKVAVSLNTGAGLDLIARRSEPTAKTGSNDALARQVIRMADEACAEAGIDPSRLQRAGVSSAGPFVLNAGLVELASPNICGGIAGPARGLPNDWMTATLEAPLRQRFTQGVRVENDAVAALEAERRWARCRASSTARTSPGAPGSAWACAWMAACCAARTATRDTAATCSSATTTMPCAAAATSATWRRWWPGTRWRAVSAPMRPR